MNLLCLPAEVRRRIFELYFEGRRLWWKAGSSVGGSVSSDSFSLLYLCREIYEESRSVMLATAEIDITEMVDLHYGAPQPAVLDMSLLKDVYLWIDGPTEFLEPKPNADILRKLSSLRTFTFSYICSGYSFNTVLPVDEMSNADLDFIRQYPGRILGDEYDMSSEIDPLQIIELHAVEPFTDQLVTVRKQQQQSFRLIAEFDVSYDGGKCTHDSSDFTYGIGSFDLGTQVATINTIKGPAKQYQFNITRFKI